MVIAIFLTLMAVAWLVISSVAGYSALQLVAWNQSWFALSITDKLTSLLLAFLVFCFWPLAVLYSVAIVVKESLFGK